ncbi:MAG: lamin tail domain-containing protein, partial [Phycisphaerae bacterium]|nr:lamin tail domain-containing protein [Phycisphaerae bacterium]
MNIPKANQNDVPLFESLEPRLLLSGEVLITEFMADNDATLADENNDYSDWLEIHNYGDVAVDLEGWQLEDDDAIWTFPSMLLNPGQYRVIFASDKDRRDPAGELHTNFKLKSGGEPLALLDDTGAIVHEYDPYPEQLEDISYGVRYVETEGVLVTTEQYFTTPTPRAANVPGILGMVEDTSFSTDRGFYTDPIDVEISTDTPDAQIRYTLNGSAPTATTGTVYTVPIHVTGTTVLRAAAYKPGYLPTNVDTHTYIFLDDVVTQSADGSAPGSEWPNYNVNGQHIIYGMDPDIVGGYNTVQQVKDSLEAVPTISLVTDLAHLFSSSTGIFVNANADGRAWERPTSVELIYPEGASGSGFPDGIDEGFQINAGLRIRGGYSRQGSNPKHAFRLFFRDEYGDSKLEYPLFGLEGTDEYDSVDLRTSQNYSWAFGGPNNNTMVRDVFSRDVQGEMGNPYTRSRYYHLYVDGQYWGLFQTQERAEASHAASYLGGDPEDYDVIKPDDGRSVFATDGNIAAYNRLWTATTAGYSDNDDYYRVQGMNPDGTRNAAYERLLDVDNLIDHMIITYYTGDRDGAGSRYTMGGSGPNNFFAAYNRENPDGFKFFEHDSEHSLGTGENTMVTPLLENWSSIASQQNKFAPHWLHEQLCDNEEYKLRFADRMYKAFFNDGALTYSASLDQINYRANQIDSAIIAESARWGDTKSNPPRNYNSWVTDVNEVRNWIGSRTNTVINQVRGVGWYPNVDATMYKINGSYKHGGLISSGSQLSMTTGSGTIYYTFDGTDPRAIGGGISGTKYTGGYIPLAQSTRVLARRYYGGNWSPLTETSFYVHLPVEGELVVTELNYHPYEPTEAELATQPPGDADFTSGDFEFIELYNNGDRNVDLLGVGFSEGIAFEFGPSDLASMAPGEFAVLVSNTAAFEARYGAGINVVGEYSRGLDSNGEAIRLMNPLGGVLSGFEYDDSSRWPGRADGKGAALDIIDPLGDYSDPTNWRSSVVYGGTPGDASEAPLGIVINEVLSHTDLPDVDSIELYNATGGTIDIGGWYLSDSWGLASNPDNGNYKKFRIPDGTSMDSGEYLVFDETDFNSSGGVDPLDFALNGAHGDDVWLMKADGAGNLTHFADHVDFNAAANGESFGRWPNASGELYPMTLVTLEGTNSPPRVGPVVISEVMYNPPDPDGVGGVDPDDLEFIELYNPTLSAIPLAAWTDNPHGGAQYLADWRFRGGVDMEFDEGTTIAAGGTLVVLSFDPDDPLNAARVADFRTYYGIDASIPLAGGYGGALRGGGERIMLQRPDSPPLLEPDFVPHLIEDEVEYDDIAPGPIGPDGNGGSLHRVHFEVFGGYGGSWRPDGPNPGVASDFSMPPIVVTPLADVVVDEDSDPSVRDVSATFDDPDPGDTLTLSVRGNTNPGLVTTDLTAGILTLSYVSGINGASDITVRATDQLGAWVEGTIAVTVISINDAPPTVVNPLANVTVDEDSADSIVHLSNVFDDVDFGDTPVLSLTGNTNTGLLTASIVGTRLAMSYVTDQNGTADITVRATDSGGLWVEDTFAVTVDPTNDAPVVVDPINGVIVDEDDPDMIVDLANVFDDIDVGDTLSLTVSANSNTDLLTANVIGTNLTLSFLPDGNGTADITIRATDSAVPGLWVEDTFTVTVNPIN